jgi:hypothetical protein
MTKPFCSKGAGGIAVAAAAALAACDATEASVPAPPRPISWSEVHPLGGRPPRTLPARSERW